MRRAEQQFLTKSDAALMIPIAILNKKLHIFISLFIQHTIKRVRKEVAKHKIPQPI